ncbi:MAG TPA: hypothetical protein VN903_11995 [Polyangia bacterium]|jgi:hypothetical protein|nr:hypothetical protein [Polyangia bacterium]
MRTRTLITGAAFLLVAGGAGKASAQLRGSDTLEVVTVQSLGMCPAAAPLTYAGGGSGLGQAAMAAGTQHIAPMSRQLNNAQCTTASRQLLLGLDGLSILAKNAQHTDPSGGACADDISALQLTGVPNVFVLCTTDAQCAAAGGTTCDTARQFCNIGGSIAGCTAAQGCSPDGTYTFDNGNGAGSDDWVDVLRQIYGGMNHTSAGTLINVPQASNDPNTFNADGTYVCQGSTLTVDGAACASGMLCPAGQFCDAGVCKHQAPSGAARNCVRNPARIDCSNPVRGVLLASYTQIVRNPVCTVNTAITCTQNSDCPQGQTCNTTAGQCVAPNICKLKHAFRRDDLSGTTDAFQAIVGLITVPPFTTLRSTAFSPFNPEISDFASTASPFCNAGTAAQNKGFSDGLDLDPYRRACNTALTADRTPYEEVCQPGSLPNNSDLSCYVNATGQPAGARPANYPQREKTSPQGRGHMPAGSTDPTGTALQADVQGNPSLASRQRCLGVVLPISIPQEVSPATVIAQWGYLPSDTASIAGSVVPGTLPSPPFPAAGGGLCNTTGARGVVNQLPGRIMVCTDGGLKAAGGLCRLALNNVAQPNRFDCLYDSWGGGALGAQEPRSFNLTPVNNVGNMSAILDNYQNPGFPGATQLRRFARRYYGLHMVRPDNSKKQATSTAPCRLATDTQQIGCLVKTSPCSIGYAGREGADTVAPFNNLSLRIMGVQPTDANVQTFVTGVGTLYQLTRALWLNSFEDPTVGFTSPNLTAQETALATCMGLPATCAGDGDCAGSTGPCNLATGRCTSGDTSIIDPIIHNNNFVNVPAGVARYKVSAGNGCPITFP